MGPRRLQRFSSCKHKGLQAGVVGPARCSGVKPAQSPQLTFAPACVQVQSQSFTRGTDIINENKTEVVPTRGGRKRRE
eukprot:3439022-Rhodomonas_salina.1